MIKNVIFLLFFIFFTSCKDNSQNYNKQYLNSLIEVNTHEDSLINVLIEPYKTSIESEMNEIISFTKSDLKKNKPVGNLGNFVTDLCLSYAEADICLMNNGGLRSSINKGNITVGMIYELMPFENELVIVELSKTDFFEMLLHIIEKGGEPISGVKVVATNNKILDYKPKFNFENKQKIKILTSDYLADKKEFFKNKEQIKIGIKLRDAIIKYCKNNDTIFSKVDDRIKIIDNEK
ncbi:MAG: hypothetical protein CMD25_07505 [Flavobacteriales bacterium]|nr:hypothetical protein [Flavobacteriales bacterium]|tara:strand:- start:1266 stop:1970 length:705 start_codon:yes stop_codon:yes gene_type:complete